MDGTCHSRIHFCTRQVGPEPYVTSNSFKMLVVLTIYLSEYRLKFSILSSNVNSKHI